MKYDIFISYARKDLDEVRRFVELLKERIPSLTYWFDITGIESGDVFEEKIISAIDNSSYLLFALSDNAIESQWTKDEVMYAKNTGKKIIPLMLKGAKINNGWFLFKFGRIDCIDTTNSIQIEKLITNLVNWTGKAPAQSISPKTEKQSENNSKNTEKQEIQEIKDNGLLNNVLSSEYEELKIAFRQRHWIVNTLFALLLILFSFFGFVWMFLAIKSNEDSIAFSSSTAVAYIGFVGIYRLMKNCKDCLYWLIPLSLIIIFIPIIYIRIIPILAILLMLIRKNGLSVWNLLHKSPKKLKDDIIYAVMIFVFVIGVLGMASLFL